MVGDKSPLNMCIVFLHHCETLETLLPETEMSPNKDWEGDILLNAIISANCYVLNYEHILMTWSQD